MNPPKARPPGLPHGGVTANPQLIKLVRALARAAAREYVATHPGICAARPSPITEEASVESGPLRPVLERQPTGRVDR